MYISMSTGHVIPEWYESDTDFFSDFTVDAEAFYRMFNEPVPHDVFSDEYRDYIMRFFAFINGSEYIDGNEGFAETDIHTPSVKAAIENDDIANLDAYRAEYEELLVELGALNPRHVIEMGFGTGKICELLVNLGYDYYGVDISTAFANITKLKVRDKLEENHILNGSFFDIDKFDALFDCVIFDKSFHHCLEQEKLLNLIYSRTSETARIILHREAIMCVEPPLALNIYSAEAIIGICMRGWLELVFSRAYLNELCARTKWIIIKDIDIKGGTIVILQKTPA